MIFAAPSFRNHMLEQWLDQISKSVPAALDAATVESWADSCVAQMNAIDFSTLATDSFCSLSMSDINGTEQQNRFINMVLLADWACYAPPLYSVADRCAYERMSRVVRSFENGFRLLVCQVDDQILPIGYTGWYPIAEDIFSILDSAPETLKDRGEIKPEPVMADKGIYVYIFNYSVVQSLRHSWASKLLLASLNMDLALYSKMGLACVTVAEDGKRIAKRYGMQCTGPMTHMGETEDVYAVRFEQPVKKITIHPKQTQEHV